MSRPTPPPLSALRRERRTQSINQWLFLPILVFLLLGVNYISWRHYRRADFSLNQFQKLSGQTLNLLSHLPGEVTLTAFLAPEADATGSLIQEDVQKLLEEYKYKGGGKVKVELVQPYLDFQAAQKLAEKFKLTSNENVVLVQYGERSRILKVAEMAEIDPGAMMTVRRRFWARRPGTNLRAATAPIGTPPRPLTGARPSGREVEVARGMRLLSI